MVNLKMKIGRIVLGVAFVASVLCGGNRQAVAQSRVSVKPEIRGFWADGFADGFKSKEQVDTLIRRLQAGHCNAIFAQMRKSGDANYQSRYEPWAFDNKTHFDALAYLIEKAHACNPRIQVHAWLNTCAVGKSHGNTHHIAIAHPDYKSLSDTGEDYDNEATKIDPGNPDAADWTFRVYLDVARRYDVDGIHFDFVRYGSTDGKGRFGYNPVSVARYNARYGKTGQPEWTDPQWMQWRRDQVTALVRKTYVMASAVKPNLAVSAATITWLDGPHDSDGLSARQFWNQKSAPMNRVFQDWRSWMEEGIIDLNCQMSYYSEVKHPDWYRHWINWGKDNQYRRWVVPSSGIWLNSIADSFQQIAAIRKASGHKKSPAGVMLYSYSGTNAGPDGKEQSYNEEFYTALGAPSSVTKSPPFESIAEFPKLPWREKPKFGHIGGVVLTADALAAVDGIKVTLKGPSIRVQRADGTGFFGFVDVKPGNYTIQVEGNGYTKQEIKVSVKVGEVSAANFFLGQTGSPLIDAADLEHAGPLLVALPANAPVRLQNAEVLLGTDTSPGRVIVRVDHANPLEVILKSDIALQIVVGDKVALHGRIVAKDNDRVLEAESVALTGMKISAETDVYGNESLMPAGQSLELMATCEGIVREVSPDYFEIESDRGLVRVIAGKRKSIGVEDPIESWQPKVGEKVRTSGFIRVFGKLDEGKYCLYPISKQSIQKLQITTWERLKRTAGWSVCIFRGSRSDLRIVPS